MGASNEGRGKPGRVAPPSVRRRTPEARDAETEIGAGPEPRFDDATVLDRSATFSAATENMDTHPPAVEFGPGSGPTVEIGLSDDAELDSFSEDSECTDEHERGLPIEERTEEHFDLPGRRLDPALLADQIPTALDVPKPIFDVPSAEDAETPEWEFPAERTTAGLRQESEPSASHPRNDTLVGVVSEDVVEAPAGRRLEAPLAPVPAPSPEDEVDLIIPAIGEPVHLSAPGGDTLPPDLSRTSLRVIDNSPRTQQKEIPSSPSERSFPRDSQPIGVPALEPNSRPNEPALVTPAAPGRGRWLFLLFFLIGAGVSAFLVLTGRVDLLELSQQLSEQMERWR